MASSAPVVTARRRSDDERQGGIAARLYRGEANVNVVGRRRLWFTVAGVAVLIAIGAEHRSAGFTFGIEFEGGNEFNVPVSVGTLDGGRKAFGDAGVEVTTAPGGR